LRGIALANWNIAEAYILKNNIDLAAKYIKEGLILCRENNSMADVRLFLLSAALKLNNNESEQYLNEAFELFDSPFPSNYSKIEFLEKALEYYAGNRKYVDAYRTQELLNAKKEHIQVSEDSLRLNLLENYYINENKLRAEKENRIRTELEIKSGRLIIVALISVLSALVTLVLAYRFRQKQKTKIRELAYQKEKEELRLAREAGEYKSRLDAIEEERNRIARELHDDIGSAMSSLNIFSGLAIEKFDSKPSESRELIKKVKEQSISISDSLSDLIWAVYTKNDTYGHLIQRMKNFCFEILSAQGINPDFRYPHELQHKQAGLEVRKNLLLIFKEAVNNIAKHSKANNAEIVFTTNGDQICLSIKDDGIGFDNLNSQDGNGTSSMVARCRSIGGKLTITSSAGSGTMILVCFSERD
jgi:signal transduction histidine kinase